MVHNPELILPQELGWGSVEHPDKGQDLHSIGHGRRDLASWRCGRSSRKLPPRQLTGSSWLRPSLPMCGVCCSRIRILPSSSVQTDTVGYCSGHNPAEDITNHVPRTPPSGFSKAVMRPSFRPSSCALGRHLAPREQNRNTEQLPVSGEEVGNLRRELSQFLAEGSHL